MKIFSFTDDDMKNTSSKYTLNEIYQQPATWKKTCEQVKTIKNELKTFIDQVITQPDFDIILTGAGTSEFVGNTLYSYLAKSLNYKVKSYGTTDLVATPENYLSATKPTLLVSFGRSGNSPESIGAIDVAESVCSNLYHLFVTCNKDGSLSKRASDEKNCFAINLTSETHDQSFAMTSSFSNMYLATLLAFNTDKIDEFISVMDKIIDAGQDFIDNQYTSVKNIIDTFNFERIVYLGSNALKGLSQESALKMLELTAGSIVTMFDTPLGFRHGPKSIIDDTTLIVIYISDNEYSRQYEVDLLKEVSKQRKDNKIAVVMNGYDSEIAALADYTICLNIGEKLDNIFLGFDYILFAQTLAVLKSLSMGLTPDNPCPTGEVNRVVKGVTLYTYKKGK